MSLKKMNIGGWESLVSSDLGYAPYFTNDLRYRIHRELAVNVVVTGEAGISKSYTAWEMCRVLSHKFWVDDIVSSYAEYMEALLKKKREGVPIGFDEPQYALDKRDWYNQVNKALIKTITSQRFRLRPVFIPIINLSMLDKVLRSYLIQYHVILNQRGEGNAYRLSPSQIEDKLYRYRLCRIEYGLFDQECGRKSCLTCSELQTCYSFRARYERKKATWQEGRDELQFQEAKTREIAEGINDDMIIQCVLDNVDKCRKIKNGSIDPNQIINVVRDKLKIKIGRTRAYEIRGRVYYDKPDLAPTIEDKK
jgi:hypothetical protein